MQKTYCDYCGDEIHEPVEFKPPVTKGNSAACRVLPKVFMDLDNHYHHEIGDICKHCQIDAIKALDDRPQPIPAPYIPPPCPPAPPHPFERIPPPAPMPAFIYGPVTRSVGELLGCDVRRIDNFNTIELDRFSGERLQLTEQGIKDLITALYDLIKPV
jgi:hypothetical protein